MPSPATEFESLLEAVPDALVGVDRSGQVRFVNHLAESLFGYDPGGMVGLPLELLVPESVRQAHRALREGYSAAPRTRPLGAGLSLTGLRRDGVEIPVGISLSSSGSGDDLRVIAAVRDMTGYRRAEADRRRLERLASMVEFSGDAIIGTTLAGVVTSWNPAAERLYGYRAQEIIGTSIGVLSPGDRPEEARALLGKIAHARAVETVETIHVRKDGTRVAVSQTLSTIRDDGDAVVGASLTTRDVTEQKEAAQYARSLIEAALDPMVTISPEGKITDVNEAAARATGVPRDALIGTSFSDYFTDPVKAEEAYQQVFEQGAVTDYPLTLRHRDGAGAPIEILYNASPYRDTDGNVLGVFASAHDVTKQVHAQKKLAEQQARELERLAELERFQRLTVGRELKMIELKKQIENLKKHGPAGGGQQ